MDYSAQNYADREQSTTLRIMQERMYECLTCAGKGTRHLIIVEGYKKIHMVGVRFHELWKVGTDHVYYVECGFLVIEAYNQMFIVEAKTSYLIDEDTKFGSISSMELLNKVHEADIYEDYSIAYRRMRGV